MAYPSLSPPPVADSATLPLAPEPDRRARIASLALLGVCWLLIFNQQRLEWSVNPTYAYGWAVPFLALFLLWERWQWRPIARRPPGGWLWLIVPAILLIAYLPVRVVQEANPDWVKINWMMTGIAMGLTVFGFFAAGGWRYLLHFSFPILFCITALPWPVWMEEYLVQSLMRANATVSAELMTLAGYSAIAKGNLIQVGTTWVNVEEACSGIRSLQTAFMMSLFFGEYYRFGIVARVGLLLASFAVAFLLNLVRTLVLTYLTGVSGPEAMDRWHDTVGIIVMLLCLAALWLLAELFQRRSRGAKQRPPAPAPARLAPFPVAFAAAGIAWLGLSEAATAGWYRYHERHMPAPVAWNVVWPEKELSFTRAEFPERTRAMMKYNEGETAAWRTGDGYRWQAYYLRWHPGRVSKFLAGGHYPTVCLPATGLRLVAETGRFDVQLGALAIPFNTYLFDENGRDVYVFHAILEDLPSDESTRIVYRQANSTERLQSVLRGERNLGQRVLGVSLTGPFLPSDAREALTAMLREIVQTENPLIAQTPRHP